MSLSNLVIIWSFECLICFVWSFPQNTIKNVFWSIYLMNDNHMLCCPTSVLQRNPIIAQCARCMDMAACDPMGCVYMVFLKLFLRLPVVLSSSPLKILEGFCCGIHSNRIHVIRNDLICFIEEGLFCLYNGSKTDKIRNYIFQRGQSSMVAIGPVRLCLVKIYIYEKTTFWLKMIWHKIGPSKNCHISPSYTTGHGVSNDAKYSVVYSSHLSMMGTRSWCVTS